MKLRCLPAQSRTVLSIHGPDAERYLNGQVTQDVRGLGENAAASCVTDAKGRLQAFVHVFRGPDGALWVEGPADQAGELEARLGRYLIADDAELTDISASWQLVHILQAAALEPSPGFTRNCKRLTASGCDLWLPAGSAPPEGETVAPEEAESLRIRAGIPAWGSELTAGMLPPEAGLDRSAISYHKGCYIGQEVLSRLKTAGKLNRRLARFEVPAGTLPGTRLMRGEQVAGTLTSIDPLPMDSGRHAALGYLGKAGFEAASLRLETTGDEVVVAGIV
jgi:folate-binding protein YgfZ